MNALERVIYFFSHEFMYGSTAFDYFTPVGVLVFEFLYSTNYSHVSLPEFPALIILL